MVELLELARNNPHINCGTILERWRDRPEGKHLSKLASAPVYHTTNEGLEMEFHDTLRLLDRQRVEQEHERLRRKSETGPLSQEEKRKFTQLLSEKHALAQPSNNR